MIKRINNLLQEVLKTDIDYYELAEELLTVYIKSKNLDYNYLIDTVQVLVLRKAYRFLTFIECEDLYKRVIECIN